MLGTVCAMVLSQLCVPSEYVGVVEMTHGIHQVLPNGERRELDHRQIVKLGLYVEVVASDYTGPTPFSDLRETCIEGDCVVHRRVCLPDLSACHYQIGWVSVVDGVPHAGLHSYIIRGHSRTVREEAERRLSIVDDEDPRSRRIPIAALARSKPARRGKYGGAVGWQGWID